MLAFAFLLLLVTFRSVVIALKAIVLNLLSVAAAYGVLVLVFQHGWGKELLGFDYTGGVMVWLPVFLFVILFGLSMDYHVFILSRIKEAHDSGMRTDDAIAHGIKSTAGVVTSAAIVMVFVFSIFGTLSLIMMKQFGVGLATAVLLDATIVRAVLLPAAMKLLGEWNWYLPRWLHWLPRSGSASAPRADAAGDALRGGVRGLLTPFARAETYRRLAFAVSALPLVVALVLLFAGWGVTVGLAITPLVVPLFIGLRFAVRQLAQVEAFLVRELLGAGVTCRARRAAAGSGSPAACLHGRRFLEAAGIPPAARRPRLAARDPPARSAHDRAVGDRPADHLPVAGRRGRGRPQHRLASGGARVRARRAPRPARHCPSRPPAERDLGADCVPSARQPRYGRENGSRDALRKRALVILAVVVGGLGLLLSVVWALTTPTATSGRRRRSFRWPWCSALPPG